jgi:peptidoglycan/LPS O-acetylase OafA/YrhL
MLLNYGRKQLSGLAWLRFGLALYLIFFHTIPAYKDLPVWLYQSVSAGHISTSVFFILSGYVLAHAYLNRDGSLRISVRRFIATRILTVYPLHLVGFALAALVMWVQYRSYGVVTAVADIPQAMAAYSTEPLLISLDASSIFSKALQHLSLLHAWNPFYQTFNIPSWSISTLAFFYVVFGLIGGTVLCLRRPFWVLIGLILVNLIAPLTLIAYSNYSTAATGFLHTNPLVRLPEFLTGIVLCRLLQDRGTVVLTQPQFLGLLGLITGLIAFIIALSNQYGPAGFYLVHNGVLLPLELMLVMLFAGVRHTRVVWLDDLANRLGNATLSLFILHLPLFYILTRLQKALVLYFEPQQTSSDLLSYTQQLKEMSLSFATYPLLIIIIVVIAVFCQERFVLSTRRWMLSPWKRQPKPAEVFSSTN